MGIGTDLHSSWPAQIQLAWIAISFVLALNFKVSRGMDLSTPFMLLAKGHRLDHSLIYEHMVDSVLECAHLCLSERCRGCQSINYEKEENNNNRERMKCQLNNETKTTKPEQLLPDTAFNYFETITIKENRLVCKQKMAAVPKSCADLYSNGVQSNGVYTIDPDGVGAFDVRCDMTTDGGGWTVFQRRVDGSEDFYRNWIDYKNGFGNLSGEFWLGLNRINRLTRSGHEVLRVDLEDFDEGIRYAEYNTFSIKNETDQYILTVKNFSGNAGDSLKIHNGMKFSTKDADNDPSGTNCAVVYKGAWWYQACHRSNLNGLYRNGAHTSFADGVDWFYWKGYHYSLKKTEMKVRPHLF